MLCLLWSYLSIECYFNFCLSSVFSSCVYIFLTSDSLWQNTQQKQGRQGLFGSWLQRDLSWWGRQGSGNLRGSLVHVTTNQEVEISRGGNQGRLSIKGLFLVMSLSSQAPSLNSLYPPNLMPQLWTMVQNMNIRGISVFKLNTYLSLLCLWISTSCFSHLTFTVLFSLCFG